MDGPAELAKSAAARAAIASIRVERRIALGSGSTAERMVRAFAERFPGAEGFHLVASSHATEELGRELGLAVRSLRADDRFDVMLDGADEVSAELDLTKGAGGALFREKFLARLSDRLVIMVDTGKLVARLGSIHAIPVEVVPFAQAVLVRSFEHEGFSVEVRRTDDGRPFVTDNGNEILDLRPPAPLEDPAATDQGLRAHAGVVETGIFPAMADLVLVGSPDGRVEERHRSPTGAHRR